MLTRQSLEQTVGQKLGTSDWIEVSQERIDAFAELTEDRQDIHLDPEAGRTAGFGGTVAHGFLTMSLLSKMSYDVLPEIQGERASINYGFDRVRFVAPVRAEARVRGHFEIAEVRPRGEGLLIRLSVSVEIQNEERPALTADWLAFYLF